MKTSGSKISFWGNPITWDWTGKLVALPFRNDVIAFGFTLAAAEFSRRAGVSLSKSILTEALLMVGLTALHSGPTMGDEYLKLKNEFSANDLSTKCIDMDPDKNLPPTIDKWGPTATKMRNWYRDDALAALMLNIIVNIATCSLFRWSPDVMLFAAPAMYREARGWLRWRNVETGKWRVDDKGPPPEPVRQTNKIMPSWAMGAATRQIAPAL